MQLSHPPCSEFHTQSARVIEKERARQKDPVSGGVLVLFCCVSSIDLKWRRVHNMGCMSCSLQVMSAQRRAIVQQVITSDNIICLSSPLINR